MLAQQFPPRGPVGGSVKRFVQAQSLDLERRLLVCPHHAQMFQFQDSSMQEVGRRLAQSLDLQKRSLDHPPQFQDSSMQEAARRQSQRCPQPLPVASGALCPPPAHPCGSSAIAITPKRSKEILEFRTRAIGLLCQFILQIDRFVLGDWRGAPCTISRNSNSNQLQLWNHSPGCQTSYLSLNITAFNLGAFSLARDLTAHWHSDLYEEQCCAGERLCCRRDRQQGRVAAALEA